MYICPLCVGIARGTSGLRGLLTETEAQEGGNEGSVREGERERQRGNKEREREREGWRDCEGGREGGSVVL